LGLPSQRKKNLQVRGIRSAILSLSLKIEIHFQEKKLDKMARRGTCLICLKETFMSPCGANNKCNALVCELCKSDNDMIAHDSMYAMENDTYKCVICKEREWKRGIRFKIIDLYENDWGVVDENNIKPVIELLFKNKEQGYI